MSERQFSVRVNIDYEDVANLLVGIVESGASSYWCHIDDSVKPKEWVFKFENDDNEYESLYPLNGGKLVIIDDEEDKTYDLTLEKIERGLVLMANESPDHFADIVNEKGDNATADVFLQYCLLGQIIYG